MLAGQAPDPATTATFQQAISALTMVQDYRFGTGAGRNVHDLTELARHFEPYGVAGKTVIHQEWERYQPFNPENFVFAEKSLNLTATIPATGGLFPGGIHSGQIFTKTTYKPLVTGHSVYAFEVRMKIPKGRGAWPAAWLYTKHYDQGDGSEIDNPEFNDMQNQNTFDWTGFNHGPGAGADIYSIKTNKWVWHPGWDFSADYHDYQMLWTPDAVYKYVDGMLVYAARFQWTAVGPAQFIVNLAWGSDEADLPGLKPTSLSEFPGALMVDHITVWAR